MEQSELKINIIEDKYNLLKINENNSNDIVSLLGPPSTISKFDKNLWIYIERKKVKKSIFKLGKEKYVSNNVLALKIDFFIFFLSIYIHKFLSNLLLVDGGPNKETISLELFSFIFNKLYLSSIPTVP